jgi:hypothetical protein
MSNDSGSSSLQHWLRTLLGAPRERDGATQKLCPAFSLGTGHSLPRSVPAVSRRKSLSTSPSGQPRDRATRARPISLILLLLNNNNNNNSSSSRAGAEESWCAYRLSGWCRLLGPALSRWCLNPWWRITYRGTQHGQGRDSTFFSADIIPWWRIGYGAPESCVPCARSVSRSARTANKVPSTNLHRPFINNQSYERD